MKKIAVFLLVLISIVSCTIKEKMVINENGSGTFSYGFDMAALLKMGGPKSDSTKVSKNVDTVFTFKEMFAKMSDSIGKLSMVEKEQLKLLEDFKINLKVNEEKQLFEYNMAFDFASLDSLKNMVSPLKSAEVLSLSDKRLGGKVSKKSEDENDFRTSFAYDGASFEKKVLDKNNKEIKNAGSTSKNKKKSAKKEADDEFSKKMQDMFKECKYSLEYHFPKKIKSISLKDAKISEDKKSFVVEIPIENLKENSDQLGFKVLFEN